MKTPDDLADLASDELVEIVGEANLDETAANEVIMAARAHWFGENDDGTPLAAETAAADDAEEAGHDGT